MNNINFKIGNKRVGPDQPIFIVAEISGNHNQSYKRAKKIIDAAINAGVDAIKLQTYTADTLTIQSNKKCFRINKGPWAGHTLYDLYKKAYTPWAWQPKLKKYAEKKGVILFSTPFDKTAVNFLEKMNVALYKVASFEIVDIPLLKIIGQTKKPVIISRGMASAKEIRLAIKTLKDNGTTQIAVLHCVSSYPAQPEQMNLSTILNIARRFRVIPGLSDHSLSVTVPTASVALGACIIEKHFTLNRADGGPDAEFSLQPNELKKMVKSVREAQVAIGKPCYESDKKESENIVFRKSLFAVENIKKGEKFNTKNVRSIRPGYGLKSKYYDKIIGKIAKTDIERGTPLSWDLIK